MPFFIGPYTLGSFQGTAGAAPKGGAAYYTRRRRYWAYMLTSFLVMLLA